MSPIVLRREPLSSGYVKVARLTFRLPGGAEIQREVESHGQAVAILPYNPARRCALVVRLFRAPPFDAAGLLFLEEACAGMIDDGDPEASVRREADEELGLVVGALELWPRSGRARASPPRPPRCTSRPTGRRIAVVQAVASPRKTKTSRSSSGRWRSWPRTRTTVGSSTASC